MPSACGPYTAAETAPRCSGGTWSAIVAVSPGSPAYMPSRAITPAPMTAGPLPAAPGNGAARGHPRAARAGGPAAARAGEKQPEDDPRHTPGHPDAAAAEAAARPVAQRAEHRQRHQGGHAGSAVDQSEVADLVRGVDVLELEGQQQLHRR